MANQIKYTENDKLIVSTLKANPDGLTLAQLCDVTGVDLKPGHVVAAMGKGLIASIGEVETEKPGHRKVAGYKFNTADVLTNADGKEFPYTDGEKEILKVAALHEDGFTLADLAADLGVAKLGSGRINALVKKGNISKADEPVTIDCMTKVTHKVYGFVKDIPEA